jgi:hypothetical protein
VFQNLAGADFVARGSGNWFGSNGAIFQNAGWFAKVGDASNLRIAFTNTGAAQNSNGTVWVQSGTLQFFAGATATSATFNVAQAGTLVFASGTYNLDSASTIQGLGDFALTGGMLTDYGAYAVAGTYIFSGTANFMGQSTTFTGALSGGVLGGTGLFSITGAFTWGRKGGKRRFRR